MARLIATIPTVHSDATTVEQYLAGLDPDRRIEMQRTLDAVRGSLPDGLEEAMDYGMITWSVPLSVKPDTYNGKPLMFAALASQKRHISLYLMPLYAGTPLAEGEFRERWAGAKRPNMGKSCVRYRSVDEIDLPLIEEVVGGVSVDEFVRHYEAATGRGEGG